VITWKITALAAMSDLLFSAAFADMATVGALKKAISVIIPAAFAQRVLFHNRFGTGSLPNSPHASVPFNQLFSSIDVVLHGNFIGSAFGAINAARRQFRLTHNEPPCIWCVFCLRSHYIVN